jgi:hypothetical protein
MMLLSSGSKCLSSSSSVVPGGKRNIFRDKKAKIVSGKKIECNFEIMRIGEYAVLSLTLSHFLPFLSLRISNLILYLWLV